MSKQSSQKIPGWMQSPEAARFLDLTESQFRKLHDTIPNVQIHVNGPKFFKAEDIEEYGRTTLAV